MLKNNAGLWRTVFAYSDDTNGTQTIHGRDGGRYFDGKAYWGAVEVTMYRYKTRTYTYTWGEWSAWSDTETEASDTRIVEERCLYKYILNDNQ